MTPEAETCPMHPEQESRAERRRLERDLGKTGPQAGVGLGWRLSRGPRRRRYSVREPPDRTLAELVSESEEVARLLGCRCV